MIRRELDGYDYLITQDDHGILAGLCAEHVGNDDFERPVPFESFVSGTRMHDAGWPLHDDNPTIDPRGRPLNVFDRPWNVALEVWGESVERAIAADPYGGLLASIHAMRITHDLADRDGPAGKSHIGEFLDRQAERQRQLRVELGFDPDVPITLGLAPLGTSKQEDQLTYNFHWLQACDLFSLAVLCTESLQMNSRPVQTAPGLPRLTLKLDRPEPTVLTVSPWPFDTDGFSWDAPARRLVSRTYPDDATFRAAYREGQAVMLRVWVRRAV
jgi:hypothetical protein